LDETRRRSSWKMMINLARCLPENVRIKQMNLDVAEVPGVKLNCIVRAADMAEFRQSLSVFLEKIGSTFTNSSRLEMRDVALGEILPGRDDTEYPIEFEFKLL